MIEVLFVSGDSIYKKLGVPCWDAERNAMNYAGPHAVVAHPPCRLWSMMRHFSTADVSEKNMAIFAVFAVRAYGGVLEHPAFSTLWAEVGLPLPGTGPDNFGGFSVSLNQHWFGHKAKKNTWLYIVGCVPMDLPLMPLRFEPVTHSLGVRMKKKNGKRTPGKKELSKKLRSATPEPFAKWLIQVAEICGKNRTILSQDIEINKFHSGCVRLLNSGD